MNKTYPPPAELDAEAKDAHAIAKRLGQAIADQHPGPQISEHVTAAGFLIQVSHPADNWEFIVAREEGDTATTLERKAKRRAMGYYVERWRKRLLHVFDSIEVTTGDGTEVSLQEGIIALHGLMGRVKRDGTKFMFVGNGGSASIASHMAEDFTKNGGVRSVTFNDAALLTCFANDYGWSDVFKMAVCHYKNPGDVLVAISSSGKSENIVQAARFASTAGVVPVTFSGFDPANPLRISGQLNFYVPSMQYGFVETAHAALLHAALDLANGWVGQP